MFVCALRRKIDYHEFQDGLRRMDTEFPVTFTTEDWNTLIVSRGLVMTNGMLDLQVCPPYRYLLQCRGFLVM